MLLIPVLCPLTGGDGMKRLNRAIYLISFNHIHMYRTDIVKSHKNEIIIVE